MVIPVIPAGVGATLKASRAADKVGDVAKKSIWSSTKKKSSVENALRHSNDHKNEFEKLNNAKEYVEKATRFVNTPPKGTLVKKRPNGDVLLYEPKTNTFAVKNNKGEVRTMFKPQDGMSYFDAQ